MATNDRLRRRSRRFQPPAESHAIEFVTIGWILSTLTTLACELIGLASALAAMFWTDLAAAALLSGFMLFAALVVGIVSLLLLAVVWRGRRQPAPRSLLVGSLMIALAAPLLMTIRAAHLL
jgi:hypothetical protein